jgi:ubiquinone/menaquinone biosynthesis C-methylase UbiE
VLGIPDLRVYEDPLIPLADDYRKAEKLQAEAERRTFAELVEYYWTLPTFPPTPADLSARFVHHVLTDDERIRGYEDLLGHGRRFLDVGCGAGVLVRIAARRFPVAVGCDVGFRWLIVARKGLEEAGEPVRLVCCCADALPFAPGTFDSVASVALLEHMIDASAATREMCRVTRPGGRTFLWTTNRFSLAPEPHVGVWGVGFLPRKWMPAYVRWRRGMAYEKKHSLSRPELGRILRAAGFREATFFLPAITGPDLVGRAWWERLAARIYRVARRVPVLSGLLAYVAPVLQVVAQAPHPSRAPKVG